MKVYALFSVIHYAYELQSIFATRLGAEEAQGKFDVPTIIEEHEVKA